MAASSPRISRHGRIDAGLAREPLWGTLFTRLFADDVKLFAEYDAMLR